VPASSSSIENGPGSGNAKAGRPRNDSSRAGQTSTQDPTKDGVKTPPDSTAPKAEQRVSRTEEKKVDKKAKPSKIGEATDAVVGGIKKIGGIFGKKKKP